MVGLLHRTIFVALLLGALAGGARPAEAAVESELIKQGVAAYDDLDYPKAIELLQKALRETLTREEKIVTYRTLGFAHAALDKMQAARFDFENLLRIDHSYELDRRIAPRVRAVFEEAKAAVATGQTVGGEAPEAGHKTPSLEPSLEPSAPKEGRPLTVSIAYPGGVAEKLRLFHRVRGQEMFSRVDAKGDEHGRFEAMIPGLAVRAPGVDYWIELTDDSGVVVATGGALTAPLTVDVAAHKKPLYAKAWFWGVLGGVVAAGAIVAGVVIATRTSIGPSTPASVTIQPF